MFDIKFDNLKIKQKLVTVFLLTGCIATLVISTLFYYRAKNALLTEAGNKLTLVNSIKKQQLEMALSKQKKNVLLLSTHNYTYSHQFYFLRELYSGCRDYTSEQYVRHETMADFRMKNLVEGLDLDELIFIDTIGTILYSNVFKQLQSENVFMQKYKRTELLDIYLQAGRDFVIKDFIHSSLFGDSLVGYIAAPIYEKDNYIGVMVAMYKPQKFVDILQIGTGLGQSGNLYLLSPGGSINAYFDASGAMQTMDSIETQLFKHFVQTEKPGYYKAELHGQAVLIAFEELTGDGVLPWYVFTKINADEALSGLYSVQSKVILFAVVVLALVGAVGYYLSGYLSRPIEELASVVSRMARGELPTHPVQINSKDEIGDMARAVNSLSEGLQKTTAFANEIGSGNLNAEFSPLGNNDALGFSLLSMRSGLKELRTAEEQRHHNNEGLTKLAGLLRDLTESEDAFYDKILSFLVKYAGVNQGAIFINTFENEEITGIALKAMYAYNRKKYLTQELNPGEGLVGQCVVERDMIFMTEVPVNYTRITSGLGEATPTCLLLMPIMQNDKVVGVLEIAAFHVLLPHEIEFFKEACTAMASVIISRQVARRTQVLLEQTQEQGEILRSQEEEMRQNMEELMATQEEVVRKQAEADNQNQVLSSIIDLIPFPVFVKDHQRRYSIVNKAQATLHGLQVEEMLGRSDDELNNDTAVIAAIRASDEDVIVRQKRIELPNQEIVDYAGNAKILQTVKVPFYNKESGRYNVLGVSIEKFRD